MGESVCGLSACFWRKVTEDGLVEEETAKPKARVAAASGGPAAVPVGWMRGGAGCVRWIALTVVAALLTGGVLVWKFLDESGRLLSGAGQWLQGVGDGLQSRTVTETLRERLIEVTSTEGDVLELAMVEMEETFSRADSRSLFGDLVYLGMTVSEIRVPVVYRYHLKLSDEWRIEVIGNECRVLAPAIRPSLPPAIRTEGMEKKSAAGWLRFNAADNLAQLEKGLTRRLEQRAGERRRIEMARAACVESVEKFLRRWVLDKQPNLAELEVEVRFVGEEGAVKAGVKEVGKGALHP